MNIVITSSGDTVTSQFDLRFGRAAYFCLYNTETKTTEFFKNEFENAQGGAGTKAAERAAELKAERVISGDFGPKAKDLLNKLKIQMVMLSDTDKTIQEIINSIK